MASRLKSDFRTAGDATRFGGQVPSFYLNASNFTGGVPVTAGGTGGTTASEARTNLNLYSQSEIDTKVSTATLGNANVIVNGNNDITVDTNTIDFTIDGTQKGTWSNTTLTITGNLTISGTINGYENVPSSAIAAASWGDHRNVGYLTSNPIYSTSELSDISSTAPTVNQYLAWTGTEYSPISLSISNFSITDLIDIDLITSTPNIGQVLKWNGANWVSDDDNSNAVQYINDLNDVDTQSNAPTENKVLAWTGAEWGPKTIDDMTTTINLNDLSVDFGIISD